MKNIISKKQLEMLSYIKEIIESKKRSEEKEKREKEENEMRQKYLRGEISKKRYYIWLEDHESDLDIDLDDSYEYDMAGVKYAAAIEQDHKSYLQWRERMKNWIQYILIQCDYINLIFKFNILKISD